MKKLFIKTYGCQMNEYDSDRMRQLLIPFGYTAAKTPEESDLIILNTCHIREKAEHKVFSDLGRYHVIQKKRQEEGKETLLVVAGCVAQAAGAEIIKQAPYVSVVVGPQSYSDLPLLLRQVLSENGKKLVQTEFPVDSKFDVLPLPIETTTSAFLSIQEGCDKFCAFCVVPYTRGAEYSRPAQDIIYEAKHLVEKGAKEITLLGQNVNAYHGLVEKGAVRQWRLAQLIFSLSEINGLERIRYTTSHPKDMDDDLIHAHASISKLMPFLHLPVQSGSDKILKAMNRKHSREYYIQIIDRLRKARPDIAFSTDIIIGFPNETEEDFRQTMELVKTVNYAQAYSFKFSQRPGTPADVMDGQVPEEIKSYRLHLLQNLLRDQQICFNKSMEGRTLPVLFQKKGKYKGHIVGKTPYMQSVHIEASDAFIGTLQDVHIVSSNLNALTGTIVL